MARKIQGIIYYIDENYNVYNTNDILENKRSSGYSKMGKVQMEILLFLNYLIVKHYFFGKL